MKNLIVILFYRITSQFLNKWKFIKICNMYHQKIKIYLTQIDIKSLIINSFLILQKKVQLILIKLYKK